MDAGDWSSVRYFALDKGDPERWTRWETNLPEIQRQCPEFVFAWRNLQLAELAFRAAVDQLPHPDD